MMLSEIPLTPDNQQFNIVINNTTWGMKIIWRETCWIMDLMNSRNEPIIYGIPLVTGANLLAQYAPHKFGFALIVLCDDPAQTLPTKTDLGIASHLYIVSEPLCL